MRIFAGMKMKRTVWAIALAVFCRMPGSAHEKWEASLAAGLNSDGWEWDAGIAYKPIPYLGLKMAIGLAGEIHALEDWRIGDWIYGDDYDPPYYDDYYDDKNYTMRFKFMPSVELHSPALINWESQGATFHLFANPGVTLSPGASGSHGARWLSWQARAGVEMNMSVFSIRLGYGITDFSLYSGRPYNENGLPDDPEHITHSGFAAISYRF